MSESDFQAAFSRWIREHGFSSGFSGGCAFELKLAHAPDSAGRAGSLKRGGYIRLDALEPHQRAALSAGSRRDGPGLYYKLGDMSVGAKPFDCFFLAHCRAYVVVGVAVSVATDSKRGRMGFDAMFVDIEAWNALDARIRARGAASVGLSEVRKVSERIQVM